MFRKHLNDSDLVSLVSGDTTHSLGTNERSRRAALNAHLAGCDRCRAHAETVRAVWQNAQALGTDAPSDDRALARVRGAVTDAARGRGTVGGMALQGGLLTGGKRLAAYAVAFAVAAAIVVAPATFPRFGGGATHPTPAPGIAYAQVEEAMRQVDTVTWRQTATFLGSEKVTRHWGRLGDNPAYLLHEVSKSGKTANKDLSDILTDMRGKTFYNRRTSAYQAVPLTETYTGDDRAGYLRDLVERKISNPVEDKTPPASVTVIGKRNGRETRRNLTPAQAGITRTAWKQTSETDANGRTLAVFRRETTHDFAALVARLRRERGLPPVPQNKPGTGLISITRETVWVDKETRRLVRKELVMTFGGRNETRYVQDDFRYNETPPAGIFDWSMDNDTPDARAEP